MGRGSEEYRLVWFQHLHKSAGTLLVNLALSNGEVLYRNHANGNPKDEGGNILPLWEYDSEKLVSFIDKCHAEGVTFVATEHGSPDFSILADDPRVFLITCLRDPLKRCASNHNYAYYSGYSDASTIREFAAEPNVHMSDDYYVRIFSRKEQLPLAELDEEDYTIALDNLSKFDLVLSTNSEHMDLPNSIEMGLGWTGIEKVDRHSTFGDGWRVLNMFRRLQFGRLFSYLCRKDVASGVASLEAKYERDYWLMSDLFDQPKEATKEKLV